jgi:glycosyltransferase involved in cell wall biosynthesis
MRVLHVSGQYTWRGGEQQIAYLIHYLSELGCENILYCPDNAALRSKVSIAKQFTFVRGLLFQVKAAYTLAKVCKQENPDIIHLHDADAHLIGVLSATLFGNRSTMVMSRRVDFVIKKRWTTRFKYQHKSIKAIICVSEAIARIVKESLPEKKVSIVYDGVLTDRFLQGFQILKKTYHLPEDIKLIGNIAALADHKDHFTFLRTATKLLKEDEKLHFFIIGADQGMGEKLLQWIRQHNLEDKITLTGFRTDIDKILPELDIFLFTSKQEGLGTSILDAFAARVPVVTTNAGGIPELIENGYTGFLCNVGDASGLSSKVRELLDSQELRYKISQQAFERLEAQFTAKRMAENTKNIYKEVLLGES